MTLCYNISDPSPAPDRCAPASDVRHSDRCFFEDLRGPSSQTPCMCMFVYDYDGYIMCRCIMSVYIYIYIYIYKRRRIPTDTGVNPQIRKQINN